MATDDVTAMMEVRPWAGYRSLGPRSLRGETPLETKVLREEFKCIEALFDTQPKSLQRYIVSQFDEPQAFVRKPPCLIRVAIAILRECELFARLIIPRLRCQLRSPEGASGEEVQGLCVAALPEQTT